MDIATVAIVGGGICGVLAARECQKRGLTYEIFEKKSQLGGNWYTKANAHSYLQVRDERWLAVTNRLSGLLRYRLLPCRPGLRAHVQMGR